MKIGARILWDEVGPEVDPLSPDNVLIFANGPMTATGYQTSNRFSISTKSPLTGTVLDANSGSYWGMQFKKTGFDALIARGRAGAPVYIEIKTEGVTIHDAQHLWGQRVRAVTKSLGQNNHKGNVLCIGPAGEHLSRIAAIMNDGERSRARWSGRGDGQQESESRCRRRKRPPRHSGSGTIQVYALRLEFRVT